jgi:hypothetical protein
MLFHRGQAIEKSNTFGIWQIAPRAFITSALIAMLTTLTPPPNVMT